MNTHTYIHIYIYIKKKNNDKTRNGTPILIGTEIYRSIDQISTTFDMRLIPLFFDTIYKFHFTISTNFYFYLQNFRQKVL